MLAAMKKLCFLNSLNNLMVTTGLSHAGHMLIMCWTLSMNLMTLLSTPKMRPM